MNNVEEMKYEEAFERLEAIIDRMDAASVPLDELMQLYEEGAALAKHCEKLLKSYEAKLVLLSDAWNAPCVNSDVIAAFLTPRPTWAPTGF